MIETLISCWLSVADSSAPLMRVRDNAASLPDSGAFAVQHDTTLHALSRTPYLPRPVAILPPVRVDAALDRARRRAPTAFVTTLRVGHDTRALASLSDVLTEAAGVQLTQYGGMGAFSTMSLRGAPPGHVTVLLDGVPLTAAARGVVDLADLPAAAIEEIEIYRGTAPASLGSPTPGGTVNLLTAAGAHARELRLATGTFGSSEARASWAGGTGAWSLLAHGGWQGSDSDFPYLDDNGTPLESADDRMTPRVNARFDAVSALMRGSYAPAERLHAAVHVEYFRRDQGVPGPGATPARNARFAAERVQVAGETRAGAGEAWPTLELRANVKRERTQMQDAAGELGYGRVDTNERFDDAGGSLELVSPGNWPLLKLAVGTALRAEGAHPAAPTTGLPDPPASHRDSRAAWTSADLRLAGDRVLLHAAQRWDRQDEHVRDTRSTGVLRVRDAARTLSAPQIGTRVRLAMGMEARGNWSRSGRAPGFDELFGIDGSITGNPTLIPERAENWDAGLGWVLAAGPWRLAAEWSHHASHVRDMVLFERSTPRGARPVNVGAARLYGEETALRAAWRGAELSACTAWLSATDRSAITFYRGRRLPQRSERQSSARLAWRDAAWTVAGNVNYQSDTFLDRANYQRAPSRTLVGASLARRVGRTRLLAEARNLGDRLAEDVAGFPLPGRMLLFSISLDLGDHTDRP